MRLNVNKEKCLGDSNYIDNRLKNIYGEGSYVNERKKIQDENKKKYMMALVMIGFLVAASVFSGGMNDLFIKNNTGNVAAISRGSQSSVPIQISGVWNGEEFTKDVVLDVSSLKDKKEKEKKDKKQEAAENKGMEAELKALELDNLIAEIVEKVGKNYKGSKVNLPSRLSDGTKITWHEENQSYFLPVLLLGLLLLYGIYKKRFEPIKKLEMEANESVMAELPGFLNKLALLMNAGLVFGSAYERIIDEKEKMGWNKESYFYQQLIKINENVKERNCSIQRELADFATRSQNKEFIRAVGIINDNISKGIMLTDKLRGESEAMWYARKKYIEEKSKLAETKLVGPLFIILGILIVITMVPAMMGM